MKKIFLLLLWSSLGFCADQIVTTNGSISAGLKVSTLTGIIKTTSGEPSVATAGTDYVVPNGTLGATPTITNNLAANTSGVGLTLTNGGTASSGNQMRSPKITLAGAGWKTTATAASQVVSWDIETRPVENNSHPQNGLYFTPTINGTAYQIVAICSVPSGGTGATFDFEGAGCRATNNADLGANSGFGPVGAGNSFGVFTGVTERMNFNGNGQLLNAAYGIMWASSTATNGSTGDTSVQRDSAGIVADYSGAAVGTTAANYRAHKSSGYHFGGTAATTNGACSASVVTGGATSGSFTIGIGVCAAVVITMGNSFTAANGLLCDVINQTTPANIFSQSANTTTTCTVGGTAAGTDTLIFRATAF